MKWLLLSATLNLQITYPSEDMCEKALTRVTTHDINAICIPAGETQADAMFSKMFDMIRKFKEMK
tara:strand:+ start:43 stop:237 length:195 start_codon:yes stop_codon:yes gene_type:complete